MSAPETPVYQPFPSFPEWAGVAVDAATFDRYAAVLEDLRTRPGSALAKAVEVATRAAAIDTGAIEGLYEVDRGFTMTVARGVAAWEKVLAAREPVVRRSFEDALRAYDFVLDLATSRTEVSEKAIREIHQLICAGQETYRVVTSAGWQERALPKGEYKDTPNNPTSRLACSPIPRSAWPSGSLPAASRRTCCSPRATRCRSSCGTSSRWSPPSSS